MPSLFSLSRYFPENTEYFYAYPAAEDSGFYNPMPPEIDEFAAARPLACAGESVKIICFPQTLNSFSWRVLHDELGSLPIRKDQILYLPDDISIDVCGSERNEKIKQALLSLCSRRKLVLAQPYLDERLDSSYQFPANLSIWLNDKKNMASYIPEKFLPRKYAEFPNGIFFSRSSKSFLFPCVVKVSASCGGDGVRICHTEKEFERVKRDFSYLHASIIVEEFISAERNFGLQFGIPCDSSRSIEFIGWHEQLTDEKGAYIGAILDIDQPDDFLEPLRDLLLEKILPLIRKKGWHGVGGFDVLMTKAGKFYFIDPNFRVTAMTTYDFLARNKIIQKFMAAFTGSFSGNESDFLATFLPIAKFRDPGQRLHVTGLTEKNGIYTFYAALIADSRKDIPDVAKFLLQRGIQSQTLALLSQQTHLF